MKNILSVLSLSFTFFFCTAQNAAKPAILYGVISRDSLVQVPFNAWYQQGYDDYTPGADVVKRLRSTHQKDISIAIFLGTWCGDSRREVPRFIKLLDAISFPMNKLTMYGLGSTDSLYKQSPSHEEAGKGIFRVPTFIVYKNGEEIGRINEFPVSSLEKDLTTILLREEYIPNYKSFSVVSTWLSEGTLKDKNTSLRGLAGQLKGKVENEHELNSLVMFC